MYSLKIFGQQLKKLMKLLKKPLHLNYSVKNMTRVFTDNEAWNANSKQQMIHYMHFDEKSTYIQNPPFFEGLTKEPDDS